MGVWIKLPGDEILIIVKTNRAHSNSIDIKMNMLIHCGVMCMTLSLNMMEELWMRGYWMLPGQGRVAACLPVCNLSKW